MHYRRSRSEGSTFFFTVVTYERQALFKDICNIELLKNSIRQVKKHHPFTIDAFVILPDHLHFMWTLPKGDNNFSMRWRLIKSTFTAICSSQYKKQPSMIRIRKQEQCIWQRRFWEHKIRDENDFIQHADYIHFNPVKHEHVTSAGQWMHSSFHHYLARGIYRNDWGTSNFNNLSQLMNIE